MDKLKNILGSTAAAIYFIFPMSFILLVLLIAPLMFLSDVGAMRSSGFAGPNTAASFIGVSGLFIGLSLLIPPLRKMYRVLPWLYAFVKVFFVDLIVFNVGIMIMNYGYQINNQGRHTTFFILMIVQILFCRIVMSIYFEKRPVKYIDEVNK